jgi:chromosomal replication initiator protein
MSTPDPALWRAMLEYLRRTHPEICRHWFEELEPLRLDACVLEVRAATPIQQNYLARRCGEFFNEAAQQTTGALVTVHFVDSVTAVESNGRSAPLAMQRETGAFESDDGGVATVAVPRRSSGNPLPNFDGDDDQIVLSPDYSFENFVTGPGNRLAQAAAVAVSHKPGAEYNPLFIHGGVGLGKTHLLQAICQKILETQPDARICYMSCDSFMNRFLESVQNGQMSSFRHRYRHVDMLIIDDIHFLTNRERTQEEFFHTFNTLYQARKQIVLSSDSPPQEIPQLEERLVSRFTWGLVTRIDKPCYETRVAILRKKSHLRGTRIPDDAICHIAAKIDSNIRELEGAITKVQSLAMLRGVEIDLALTQQALGDDQPATQPQLTIQNIIDAVSNFYGVKLAELQSKRRHRSITVPRQVCMYLARKRTRYSLEEIGGYFGGRDHTTVLHAIKTTEDRMSIEAEFASHVGHIDRLLTENGG